MTPEEFKAELESLMKFMSESFQRSEERLDRIEAQQDRNTILINELGVRIDNLTTRMEQTAIQIQDTNATVAAVARLLDRHIRNGHGAKPKRKRKK